MSITDSSPAAGSAAPPLVLVEDLSVRFEVRRGLLGRVEGHLRAVDGVSFSIEPGATLGLVGESGCGKTTLGRAILGLQTLHDGQVVIGGIDVHASGASRRARLAQAVFQDPAGSLNPRMTIGDALAEPLAIHRIGTRHTRRHRVVELLERVGLRPDHARRYPRELSGGQKQRVGIARAIALSPRFIVCDEPVSALDVSVQAQILRLLADLKSTLGISYLFISHNLAVVRQISTRVAVMYLGTIVETASAHSLFGNARHPYTLALLAAVPDPDPAACRRRILLTGEPPSPLRPPSGCRFHPRCPIATDQCRAEPPPLTHRAGLSLDHLVACHHAEAPVREHLQSLFSA